MKPVAKDEPIVIIGAGLFGLSTALELKKRGYLHVTVLDRFLPPVPDGSSVDISRVIRVEYADPLYGQMAREALEGWQTKYSKHFHTSGFVMLGPPGGESYVSKAKEETEKVGGRLIQFNNADKLRDHYPSIQAKLEGLEAYLNPAGGWADAESSIRQLSNECSSLGVSFILGPRGTVHSLKYEHGRVVGVNVAQGPSISASLVVLATGAWSNRLVDMSHASSASGQPVGFIQLTDAEAQKLKGMPVMINLETGIFVFPPTPDTNILKVARHGYGFGTAVPVVEEDKERLVSSPRRDTSNAVSGYLPDDADAALRAGLAQLVPEFQSREWMDRRLCWYSDTPAGDFVVDHHPKIPGLFFATGGAGQ
jgi:sarcosine oxidase/L-pipecolate oxidase